MLLGDAALPGRATKAPGETRRPQQLPNGLIVLSIYLSTYHVSFVYTYSRIKLMIGNDNLFLGLAWSSPLQSAKTDLPWAPSPRAQLGATPKPPTSGAAGHATQSGSFALKAARFFQATCAAIMSVLFCTTIVCIGKGSYNSAHGTLLHLYCPIADPPRHFGCHVVVALNKQ